MDVDVDVQDRNAVLALFSHVPASMLIQEGVRRHPSGIYIQAMPANPLTGDAIFDYNEAVGMGFFKIDVINNSVYDGVRSPEHLDDILDRQVEWDAFAVEEVVSNLAHIGNHFDVVSQIKPRSIEDLAVALALIRPGKRHLLYRSRAEIDAEVWTKTEKYRFKRAHALAYAQAIIVQLAVMFETYGED